MVVVVRTKGEETKRSDHHQEVEVAVMVAKRQKRLKHGSDDDDE